MKKLTAILLSLVMIFAVFNICGYAETEKPFYLVLGDSIAFGSGLTNSREACYGKIVADTNGYEYVNHSVPGHTTSNLINRLKDGDMSKFETAAGRCMLNGCIFEIDTATGKTVNIERIYIE